MSFRHDKKRGNHPITPKKGIKEVDLNIREKGNNDRITVSIKSNSNDQKKQEEQLKSLREGNIERMGRISKADRERVWEAMGGIKDINSLNFEDSKKLWMEHGKYPYAD